MRVAMTCLTQNMKHLLWKTYRKWLKNKYRMVVRSSKLLLKSLFIYFIYLFVCLFVCLFVFRKVILMEGEDGAVHLKNLSLHSASSEEEGMLIIGFCLIMLISLIMMQH